jgi:hypothetical protein
MRMAALLFRRLAHPIGSKNAKEVLLPMRTRVGPVEA